jgi:hypothetical protein
MLVISNKITVYVGNNQQIRGTMVGKKQGVRKITDENVPKLPFLSWYSK